MSDFNNENSATDWRQNFRSILQTEFARLKAQNGKYSLRSFAKQLGIAPGPLSEFLSQKPGWQLSKNRARLILAKCSLPAAMKNRILLEIDQPVDHERSEMSSELFHESNSHTNLLHLALMAASLLPASERTIAALGLRLGRAADAIRGALDALQKQRFVTLDEEGKIADKQIFYESTDGVSSQTVRNHHEMILQKSASSLSKIPASERIFSAGCFAGSSVDLQKLKAKIRILEDEASSVVFQDGECDTIYQMAVQVIPLDCRTLIEAGIRSTSVNLEST